MVRLAILNSRGLALVLRAELYAHDFRDAWLLHGYAVNDWRCRHRALVVGYHDELRLRRHLADELDETPHVLIIKRRVHLVQDAEGRRYMLEDADQQRECGQRLLAAR